MNYFKWITAAALVGSATACVESAPYGGGSSYGYQQPTYNNQQPTYYSNQQPTYYGQQPTYYARQPANNYYTAPQSQPQVVTQKISRAAR